MTAKNMIETLNVNLPAGSGRFIRLSLVAGLMLTMLTGCSTLDRLSRLEGPPPLSQIENPHSQPNYSPISMPMPRPNLAERRPNSLWRPGARSFFKDQRASEVGDIITLNIDIEDEASLSNTSTRTRSGSENSSLQNLLGYEGSLAQIFPEALVAGTNNLAQVGSNSQNSGQGSISRDESIELKVAATVTQVLPNGNLVIYGRQEIRVNSEVRELVVGGIIRPEDISTMNAVNFEDVAEARVSYGGRGYLSDVQQARYGQELLDIFLPF